MVGHPRKLPEHGARYWPGNLLLQHACAAHLGKEEGSWIASSESRTSAWYRTSLIDVAVLKPYIPQVNCSMQAKMSAGSASNDAPSAAIAFRASSPFGVCLVIS